MNYALVNKETNIVENIIVWDGITEWTPPANVDVIFVSDIETAYIGGTRNSNGSYSRPPEE
jgi:hypothetical protein